MRLLSFVTFCLLLAACGSASSSRPASSATELTAARTGQGDVREASTFPRDDAATALRAAEGGLRSCNDSAVPRPFEVTLHFDPSGKVGKVDVVPGEGHVASCVRARLSEVSVVPFKGEPATLRATVSL
jgi:hypothetical protein